MRKISKLAATLLALSVAACTPTLLVRPDQGRTLVTVKDQSGEDVVTKNPGATSVKVHFDRSSKYKVQVEGEEPDLYEKYTFDLSEDGYNNLPINPNDKDSRILDVKVKASRFRDRPSIIVLLMPGVGYVTRAVKERSYIDVVEQGGAAPAMIKDIPQGQWLTGMCLSPDGNRIVYSVTAYDTSKIALLEHAKQGESQEVPMLNANLYAVSTSVGGGGGVEHITDEDFQDMYPGYTADGKFLLFGSNRRRTDSSDILRTSGEGRGGIANIYMDQRNAQALKPTQSKDGTMAFNLYPASWKRTSDAQLWTLGGTNQFPTQIANGTDPAISPDGANIAYIGTDGNLWMVKVNGTGATQLTDGATKILEDIKKPLEGQDKAVYEALESRGMVLSLYHPYSFPSWSPDGKRLLFTSMSGSDATGRHNEDIWIMNADGSGSHQLTTNGSVDRFPLMSPDAKYIFFYSNRGEDKWAIWRIAAP